MRLWRGVLCVAAFVALGCSLPAAGGAMLAVSRTLKVRPHTDDAVTRC